MNRKLVLLCVCAMALAFAGLQAVAQDKPDQPSQPASPGTGANPAASVSDANVASKVDARLQQLTTELGLSDDQQKQIKPILVSASKRLQAVKNDPQRSIDDKNSKMDEIHDNARGQIRQFLTPDQSKKLDAMKADDVI
jgi:Spy/CpxP family protein refolding chaperone